MQIIERDIKTNSSSKKTIPQEVEVTKRVELSPLQFVKETGKLEYVYKNEKEYTQWLTNHFHILKQALMIDGDGLPVINNSISLGCKLRPDMLIKLGGETMIIEIKHARNDTKSHAEREQIQGIAQLLQYDLYYHGKKKLVLIANSICKNVINVVVKNSLDIMIIEANPSGFAVYDIQCRIKNKR